MARSQARIRTSVWRNRDFTALPASAQGTYWMVLAQADVNMAGVVPYMHARWASFRGDPGHLSDDLEILERGDFLIIDRDTHETWIRTFVKNDGALTSRTTRKSMWTAWTGILSPTIRRRFLEQLDGVTVTHDGDEVGVIEEALKAGWVTSRDVSEARNASPLASPLDAPPDGGPDAPPDAPSMPPQDDDETDPPSMGDAEGDLRARLPSSTSSTSSTEGRARPREDDQTAPPDTNGTPTPTRHWETAWATIIRWIKAYGPHDTNRPPLDDVVDPRAAAAARQVGIARIRADERGGTRFDFRDAWKALSEEDVA